MPRSSSSRIPSVRNGSDARAALDPPDADTVYTRHLERCKRLGIEPVPRELAQDLIAEWSDVIARTAIPPSSH